MGKLDTVKNGKGSAVRKGSNLKAYEEGWERIFGKRKKKKIK